MAWLYRLQQRIAITRQECYALLGISFVILVGILVGHIQHKSTPPVPEQKSSIVASHAPADPFSPITSTPTPLSPENPLVLNSVSVSQLKQLPGIGPKLAARIIAYRDAHGDFSTVDDLAQVRGIGPKTLARIRPLLTTR